MGLFELKSLLVGLTNTITICWGSTNGIVRAYIGKFVFAYLANISLSSESAEGHITYIRMFSMSQGHKTSAQDNLSCQTGLD